MFISTFCSIVNLVMHSFSAWPLIYIAKQGLETMQETLAIFPPPLCDQK
jgi:hypothetical protein